MEPAFHGVAQIELGGTSNRAARSVFGPKQNVHPPKVWANSIRLLSLVHVILFALCILLRALDQMVLVHVIGWVIFVDLVLFVLHGAHPIAPLSTLCTALIWKRKGSAVVILPYKAVFVAYLLALGRLAFNSQGAENASEFNSVLIGGIINSSMLAVTRF